MKKLSNFTTESARLECSVGCFEPSGDLSCGAALTELHDGQPGDGCMWLFSSMVLTKDLYCDFPFI